MGDTYDCAAEAEADRAQQWQLLAALGAWRRALRRDTCNAWCIRGAAGHIYTWGDGKTWALWVHCRSPRHWTATKRRLTFCDLTQDGDEEGCLRLRRLPTLAEATVIREVLGIRKSAELSPEELERRKTLGKRLARGAGVGILSRFPFLVTEILHWGRLRARAVCTFITAIPESLSPSIVTSVEI